MQHVNVLKPSQIFMKYNEPSILVANFDFNVMKK